jgi:hypothetical protein
MKISPLAALSLLVGPAVAEIYFKEDFNDEVRKKLDVKCFCGCEMRARRPWRENEKSTYTFVLALREFAFGG